MRAKKNKGEKKKGIAASGSMPRLNQDQMEQ